MPEAQRQVTIEHSKGLHARPATVFVQTANEFDADIDVGTVDGDEPVDAKSSIQVMSLGAAAGDDIVIAAQGADSDQAVSRLAELVEADFELDDGAESEA